MLHRRVLPWDWCPPHLRQRELDVLVDQERDTGARDDAQQIGADALPEPGQTLAAPDLPYDVKHTGVRPACVVGLETRADYLVWVGDRAREDLRESRDDEVVRVAQAFLPRLGGVVGVAEVLLELLVGDEVESAMADADEAGEQATEEAACALFADEGAKPCCHGRVGIVVASGSAQHACLDDPDRVCEDGRKKTRTGGCDEIIEGREGRGGAMVGAEETLHLSIPQEVQCPACRVADYVGCKATI